MMIGMTEQSSFNSPVEVSIGAEARTSTRLVLVHYRPEAISAPSH